MWWSHDHHTGVTEGFTVAARFRFVWETCGRLRGSGQETRPQHRALQIHNANGVVVSFQRFGQWLVYLVVRVVICVIQTISMESCEQVARLLAWLAVDVIRIRYKTVDENLKHAFPEWGEEKRRQVAREMWEHLVLMVCEIAHAPRKIHRSNWRQHIILTNLEPQTRAMLSERPCVLLSAHFGNFEVGAFAAGLFGFPTYSIARPLDNPFINEYMNEFRGMYGQTILPKERVATQVACLLDEGANLALLGDQAAGAKGCWIDFFGRPASYHKALATFPLSSGAPLVLVDTRRVAGPMRFELRVLGVYDPATDTGPRKSIQEVTQWYNDHLEKAVRESPEQYWWVHRRWKDPRKPRKAAVPKAA